MLRLPEAKCPVIIYLVLQFLIFLLLQQFQLLGLNVKFGLLLDEFSLCELYLQVQLGQLELVIALFHFCFFLHPLLLGREV